MNNNIKYRSIFYIVIIYVLYAIESIFPIYLGYIAFGIDGALGISLFMMVIYLANVFIHGKLEAISQEIEQLEVKGE